MSLSVSALAWPAIHQEEAFSLLRDSQVEYIEQVPFRIGDPEVELRLLSKYGLQELAFQALLFGTTDLHLFKSDLQREKLLSFLVDQCILGEKVGIKNLVFGSPKNRWIDETILSKNDARSIAIGFFSKLGDHAFKHGVKICIEPNPNIYGANFLTSTLETGDFVKEVNHPGIKMNLDLGTVTLNQESIEDIWVRYSEIVSHIHISNPHLLPIRLDSLSVHEQYSKFFRTLKSTPICSIEMVGTTAWREDLVAAISLVKPLYA